MSDQFIVTTAEIQGPPVRSLRLTLQSVGPFDEATIRELIGRHVEVQAQDGVVTLVRTA